MCQPRDPQTGFEKFPSVITHFSSCVHVLHSQRNDGWKCVWIDLICPCTLISFDCLKSSWCNLPSESHRFHFGFQGSCYPSFCLTNIITDTHISHSSGNFILKKPTWLEVIPKINFPCNFCHLGWSDFRLNWFLLKCWTQCWPRLWSP